MNDTSLPVALSQPRAAAGQWRQKRQMLAQSIRQPPLSTSLGGRLSVAVATMKRYGMVEVDILQIVCTQSSTINHPSIIIVSRGLCRQIHHLMRSIEIIQMNFLLITLVLMIMYNFFFNKGVLCLLSIIQLGSSTGTSSSSLNVVVPTPNAGCDLS